MTIKSMVQLLAQAAATLPDNTTQLIDPAAVRNMVTDFIDSVKPGYGAMQLTGPSAVAVTATPTKISPWASVINATAGFYTVSAANGEVTRQINSASLAGATDFIIISGDIDGPNNDNVLLTLYKNGVATPFSLGVTTQGVGEFIGFNLVAITYTANSASNDAVYDLRISGTVGNKNLRNMTFVAQSQPVNSY